MVVVNAEINIAKAGYLFIGSYLACIFSSYVLMAVTYLDSGFTNSIEGLSMPVNLVRKTWLEDIIRLCNGT